MKTNDIELQEWHAQRLKGIGGSESAALLGRSKFMSNTDLWEIKTGRRKQADISENQRVKYGNAAESPLIQLFALDFPEYQVYTGKDKNNLVNAQYSFIRGSLDGILTEIETKRKGILEIKTALVNNGEQTKQWDKQVPEQYFLQVLHYFLVNPDFQFAKLYAKLDFAWERPSELRAYHFERKDFEDDLKYLQEKIIEFWQYVETGTRPNLILVA